MSRYGRLGRRSRKFAPFFSSAGLSTPSSVEPPDPPPPPSGDFIVDEVSTEADLRNHPDIAWYSTSFVDWATASADWNMNPNEQQKQESIYGPATTSALGPRWDFIDVPEWSGSGNRAIRWTSMFQQPFLNEYADGNGSSIMNWKKYFNNQSLTRQRNIGWAYPGGSALNPTGNVRELEMYARYGVYLENNWRDGVTEIAVKAPNMSKFLNAADSGFCGGPQWIDRADVLGVKRYYANTYWWGNKPIPPGGTYQSGGFGGQVVSAPNAWELNPGQWHTYEIHLKLNSFVNGVAQPDAQLEFWFDDLEVYSAKDFVLSTVMGSTDNPLSTKVEEIAFFWGELFHGGGLTPLTAFHTRLGGFCVSRTRRIGKLKLAA